MKNSLKFFVIFLLALSLLLSLCACKRNQEPEPTEPDATEPEPTEPTEEKITLEQLGEYVIVYPALNENAKTLSRKLAKSILDRYGLSIPVVDDATEPVEKEILIGAVGGLHANVAIEAPSEGKYLIAAKGTKIYARGANALGEYHAVNGLIDILLGYSETDKCVSLPITLEDKIPVDGAFKAMSFNLMASSTSPARMISVVQTIRNIMPDTIGVQEGSPTWMNYLDSNLGQIYAYVGEGRNGGASGEYSAILYRKDRFELVESATKWLSDTPETVSKYEESGYNRIYTYAVLKEKATGKQILVVNTHLDNSGSAVRNKQIAVLMAFLAENEGKYPIILTGDFNAGRTSEVYSTVTAKLGDSAKIAKTAEDSYTYHKYGEKQSYLDYIFVSDQLMDVSYFEVITEEVNGTLPSDHYPLYIAYTLK